MARDGGGAGVEPVWDGGLVRVVGEVDGGRGGGGYRVGGMGGGRTSR